MFIVAVITAMFITFSCEKEVEKPMKDEVAIENLGPYGGPRINFEYTPSLKSTSGWDGSLLTFNSTTSPMFWGTYVTDNHIGSGTGSVKYNYVFETVSIHRTHIESGDEMPEAIVFDWYIKSNIGGTGGAQICVYCNDAGHADGESIDTVLANTWTNLEWDAIPTIQDALDYKGKEWSDISSMYVEFGVGGPSGEASSSDYSQIDGLSFDYIEFPSAPTVSGSSGETLTAAEWAAGGYMYTEGFTCTYGYDDYDWDISGSGYQIISGSGTYALVVRFTTDGTRQIKARVKNDENQNYSDWSDSHSFTLTIN